MTPTPATAPPASRSTPSRTCRPPAAWAPYEQRIYFGEQTTQYSIVGGPTKELDYADKTGEKSYSYTGHGGVSLDNPLTRAAYAVTFGEPQILYSGAIGHGSQILYNRTPKERVEAVAPWLTIDGDPYPAVVDGQVQWIVDAYTTTNGYPYASRTTLGDTTADSLTDDQRSVVARQNRVNYIRNSVKATVDAYTGTVTLYQWDTQDPVLKTWMKAFPHTVQPKSAIPADLHGAPALPAGPVQGAAPAAREVPRHRGRAVLQRQRGVAGAGRPGVQVGQGGAAVLPEPEDAGRSAARASR